MEFIVDFDNLTSLSQEPVPLTPINSTNNITISTFVPMQRTLAELIMGTITFLVILLMTVVGNALVILSVFTHRPLKKVQNYFIVSLASADFAVAVLVMPLHLIKFLVRGRWLFGLILCQMWLTFDILCCTASILNLTAIALDRYWAIHMPIEYANKRTLGLVGGMITCVWLLSALISVPPLIGWNDWSGQALKDSCELTTDRSFVVFSASGSFFIPLSVMTVLYTKIFFAARERILKNRDRSALTAVSKTQVSKVERIKLKIGKPPKSAGSSIEDTLKSANHKEESPLIRNNDAHSDQPESDRQVLVKLADADAADSVEASRRRVKIEEPPAAAAVSAAPQPQNSVLKQQKQREKISVSKEKKAAKTLAVIMGVFVLCWLPFFLMYVILPFCAEHCYLHPKVAEAITWLGYINSAINPVIYTIFNMDFRRAFEKLLCLKKQRRGRR